MLPSASLRLIERAEGWLDNGDRMTDIVHPPSGTIIAQHLQRVRGSQQAWVITDCLPRRVTMKCMRCNGLMIVDHLVDMKESYVPMWMEAMRCLSCGNIVDPLIHYHRADCRVPRAMRLTSRMVQTAVRPTQAA
jgi:hypothetical protein